MNHIEQKDKGDNVSLNLRKEMDNLKARLKILSKQYLLDDNDKESSQWYKSKMLHLNEFRNNVKKIARKSLKNATKGLKEDAKEILTQQQIASLVTFVTKSVNDMSNIVVNNQIKAINNVVKSLVGIELKNDMPKVSQNVELRSKVAPTLFEQIKKTMDAHPNNDYLNVVYKDKKTYKYESYIEMKVRTEVQREITDNLISNATNLGMVFFMPSYYGDCAEDHKEAQEEIYVSQNWMDIVKEEWQDQVQNYITQHKIKTVEEITQGEPYLTTRPNCRHYFTPLAIDEVLELKDTKDINEKQKEENMSFNGKYNSEKYEDLQKQRALERKIRQAKDVRDGLQTDLNNAPKDLSQVEKKAIERQLDRYKKQVSAYQKSLRELIDNNNSKYGKDSNLVRDYKREKPNNIYHLGVKKSN